MRRMTMLDLLVYSWTGLFVLVFCVGWPPLAALYLLLPRWHARRLRHRDRWAAEQRLAAEEAWLEQLAAGGAGSGARRR
jgi:hypothetical protein